LNEGSWRTSTAPCRCWHGTVTALAGIILATAFTAAASVTISGSVVDETGNPVSGARISATETEPAATISGAGTSDAAGEFRVELPGAGNYQLLVEREGFFLLLQKAIDLDPSVPINIRLVHLKELAESVDVAYSPPVVDPEQTTQVKRLDGQTILNLPYAASQDYRQALPLMSGAILDNTGQVHFNGADINETSYRLDGFDVSDAATGGLVARVSVDTVQAVEWNANRMPAEDKGSAGTVNIRTEMGDDRWRFGATNPIPSFDTSGGFHLNHWSPRFMTSGPLKKGKVWFHTALDPFYAVSTVASLPDGQNRSSSFSGSDLSRSQWNISNQQTLTASVLYNRSNIWNDGLSVLNPLETTVDQRTTLLVGTVKDQFVVNGNLIEAGFADTGYYVRTSPVGADPYVITPFGSSGNFFRDQTLRTARQEGVLHAAFKPAQAAGTHQIRIGTDIENSNLNQTMLRHDLSVVRADDSLVRTVSFQGSPAQSAGDFEAYAYVSDHWVPVPTLAIDIGLRTQWSRVTGAAPPAPRLAVAWAPRKLRGAKLSAGWGIYYDPITLALLALGQEQTSLTTFYSTAGAPVGAPMESMYVVNMRNLRTPRVTVTSLSAEKALPWNFFGRVDLTSRQGSRGFALDEALPTPLLNEYVINNSLHTSYRAAEVALRRTFRARYQWYGSYMRSEATSSAVVAYSVENPLLSPQAPGPQAWDAPNRFLMWGWVPVQPQWFPQFLQPVAGDTDLQLLCEYHTGFPFSATTETGYLASSPDSHRFPDYLSINVALERQFHFRGYLWALRAAVVNVLDRPNPNVVNSDANSPQFLSFQRGQERAINLRLRFLGRK
jgi:Carboxypeptidase regulatory-like domain